MNNQTYVVINNSKRMSNGRLMDIACRLANDGIFEKTMQKGEYNTITFKKAIEGYAVAIVCKLAIGHYRIEATDLDEIMIRSSSW